MLIVRHAQRFKGKLSTVNGNTELEARKIKVKYMGSFTFLYHRSLLLFMN